MSHAFDRIWNDTPFALNPDVANQLVGPCVPAVMFQAWIDALFEQRLECADLTRINQLKILVQDRYFLFQRRLAAEHSPKDGQRPDHRCVYSVFEEAINTLHQAELTLAPPPLIYPPVSPPPHPEPRTDLPGILFGDEEELR